MNQQSSAPAPVSALELAALSAAALPELQLREIRGSLLETESGQWCHLADSSGSQWLAWAPSFVLSEQSEERYLGILGLLEEAKSRGQVPWVAPTPTGVVDRAGGGQVLVFPYPGGSALTEADLSRTGLLPSSLGSALAALHELDSDEYASACRRFASSDLTRKALRALVDSHSAAVPSRLRSRWVDAIQEDSLWGFDPVPLHGSLAAEYVYAANGAVVGFSRFDQAAVGDPAQDVMWLMYYASDAFLESFESTYSAGRSVPDLHLLTRAQLLSELETLRWYSHGVKADSRQWRDQGLQALRDLDADIGDHRLVPHRPEVIQISFTAEEEPLLRLQESGSGAARNTHAETDAIALDVPTGLHDPFPDSGSRVNSEQDEASPEHSGPEASASEYPRRVVHRKVNDPNTTGSIEVP